MNALVTYSVPDMERMALAFTASKLFGIATPDQALALCLIAQAEGRHPASAAQDYHIIQGKPSKKADAMLRDFIAGGGKVEWHQLDDTKADATFSHPAGGSVRISWDMDRAKQAQISTPMWKKYPRQMLRSRVVSEGVRTVFPMATSGMYVPEEVEDIAADKQAGIGVAADVKSAPMIEGDVVSDEPRKSSAQAKRDGDWEALTAEIDACPTVEQLEILVHTKAFQDVVKRWPTAWVDAMQSYVMKAREGFAANPPVPPNFDNLEPDHVPV